MSRQHFDEHSSKKYTLTLFISFAVLFCFAMLMMLWHGDFNPVSPHESTVNVKEGPSEETHTEKQSPASDSAHYAR